MANTHQLVDHFFRHEYGRLVSHLTRALGVRNLDLVEDVVQTSLMQALQSWSHKGIPEDPTGWLFRVAKNRAIDSLRRSNRWDSISRSVAQRKSNDLPVLEDLSDQQFPDDQLRMLFLCCCDELPVESQVALALKTLCGFDTAEIARALLTSEANIQKRLFRARERLKESKWELSDLDRATIQKRIEAVRTVIYLLFNEGYHSASSDRLIRKDLCEEAIRLGLLLCDNPDTNEPASQALMSLMYYHAARFEARTQENGEIFLLEDQDRNLWDQRLLREGLHWMVQSARGESLSRYHLEGAIVAEHCLCSSFQAINWGRIVELYDLLVGMLPGPIHLLNRAVAVARWKGPDAGLQELARLDSDKSLRNYYLWNAVLGELNRQAGNLSEAGHYLSLAFEQCPSIAERKLISSRLDGILDNSRVGIFLK